jgi:hypothetical protein
LWAGPDRKGEREKREGGLPDRREGKEGWAREEGKGPGRGEGF